jgi:hypothetical protein
MKMALALALVIFSSPALADGMPKVCALYCSQIKGCHLTATDSECTCKCALIDDLSVPDTELKSQDIESYDGGLFLLQEQTVQRMTPVQSQLGAAIPAPQAGVGDVVSTAGGVVIKVITRMLKSNVANAPEHGDKIYNNKMEPVGKAE